MIKRRKPKTEVPGFYKGLLIWAALLTVTGIAVLAVLWQFLAAYERSIPEHSLEELLSSPELLREAAATDNAELDALLYELKLEGKELTCVKKTGEYSAAQPVYSLLAGGRAYFTVTLAAGEELGFGMKSWRIREVIADPSYYVTELHTLSVTVPAGAPVYVDGEKADESAVTERNAVPDALNPYEAGELLFEVYELEGFFAPPEVRALLDGVELIGTSADGYTYVFLPGEPRTVTISAPDGAVVTVNGYILDEAYIVAHEDYADVSEYERGAQGLPRKAVYSLDGMLGEPGVEAHLEGLLLSIERSGDSYAFEYPDGLMYSLTLTVPDGASAVVAGRTLDDSALTLSGRPYPELEGLSGIIGDIPAYSVYRLEGLYLEPEVSAADASGALTLITESGEGRALELEFARVSADGHDTETLLALMRSYVEYTAYGSSETLANFNKMLPYMMEGSPVLNRLRDSIESIKWNSVMTSIVYNTVETYSFVDYSADCYSCKLHCDVTLSRWGSERHYDIIWDVVCVRKNGGWLVWEMKSSD